MDKEISQKPAQPHLIWVFSGKFETTLDAATWLNTTRELRKLGWHMTLVAAGADGEHMISDTNVYCLSAPNIYILGKLIFHVKLLFYILSKWSKTSLILFNQPSAPWLLPLNILRNIFRGRLPLFVLDTRTVQMEDPKKSSFRDKLRGWLYDLINKVSNICVDGQTAITRRMAIRVKIPPDRLWGIWPSGADLDLFKPAIEKRIWPKKSQPIVLTYIGILHYERNLMSLCEATEMANQAGMNFRLILAGSGTEKEALEKFAQQTNGRIEVYPSMPHDQIPFLLAKAHVGVLPFPDDEKYRVSSPIKLFEYMASGMAIMATRIVCHTDVIGNGEYAFWSEEATPEGLFDTLKTIWDSQSILESMGNKAAQASVYWTWNESAKKLSHALIFGLSDRTRSHQQEPHRHKPVRRD
jgi:glycosyltransferase involved in cell wall biosynthesis